MGLTLEKVYSVPCNTESIFPASIRIILSFI